MSLEKYWQWFFWMANSTRVHQKLSFSQCYWRETDESKINLTGNFPDSPCAGRISRVDLILDLDEGKCTRTRPYLAVKAMVSLDISLPAGQTAYHFVFFNLILEFNEAYRNQPIFLVIFLRSRGSCTKILPKSANFPFYPRSILIDPTILICFSRGCS